MKGLYKMHVDCGRMGSLEGLFVEDTERVNTLLKSQVEVYWGEVLGKHSEVYGTLEPKELTLVTMDENVLKIIKEFSLENGFNPFHYQALRDEEDRSVSEVIDDLINKG